MVRVPTSVLVTLVAASTVSAANSPALIHDEIVPLTVVLARANDYIRAFESAFGLVICDEAYTQGVQMGQGPLPPAPVSRRIQSEMLFIWIPEDRHWLSVRNVLVVDGKRVADGQTDLEHALNQPLAERESRLHRLAEHSARFNIGSIYRNFNNPTLALQFLDSSYQPSRMEELYRTIVVAENPGSAMRTVTRFNTIRAVATYSNFRRFETSGRPIPPK
jgi:hypothetical protein